MPSAFVHQVTFRNALFLHALTEDIHRPVIGMGYIRRSHFYALFMLCFHSRTLRQFPAIDVQSAHQECLTAFLQLCLRDSLQPVWRTIDLLFDTRQIDVSFRCYAALVIGYVYLLTKSLLGFSDGLSDGQPQPDVQLPTRRIVHAQHQVLPVGHLVGNDGLGALDGFLHQLQVVHIDARHKRKRLGDDVLLRPVVIVKGRIVRTNERQLVLQLLVAPADVGDHLLQPALGEQPVQLLPSPTFSIPTVPPAVLCVS